jgi:hypothetical protein
MELQRFLDETVKHPSEFPDDIHEFDNFLQAAGKASVTKTWSRIFEPTELWDVPKVSLLLADTTFVYGGGGHNPTLRIFKHVSGVERFIVPVSLGRYLQGKQISSGFFYFPRETVKQWTEDARSLIEAGRLAYLPDRILLTHKGTAQSGQPNWELLPLDPHHPWNVLNPITASEANTSNLVSLLRDNAPIQALRQLLEMEVPVIREFSLSDYHRLLDDERESVIKVRKALQEVVGQLHEHTAKTDDPNELTTRALKIRDEIIRPELATLEEQFRRITTHRRIRMSGATLGTLVLSAGAILFPDFAAYSAVLGGAGMGAAISEYAEYLRDKGQLRDNPYHFLWQLRRHS